MDSKAIESRVSEAAQSYATFYVGDLFLGIEVTRVQELLRFQEITPVPLAPEVIQGLINLRGHIVTAVDMRRRLGFPPRSPDSMPMNLVLRSREGAVSLVVDEIGDVLELAQQDCEPPPATIKPEIREITDCIFKLDGTLLLALSAGALLQSLSNAAGFNGEKSC